MNRVRIFISSPGDVAAERNQTLAVVEKLQVEFAEHLTLEPLLWEQEPLLASADFQSQIRSPADFDIFATIISERLGSPLGNQFLRPDGTEYASGTEFEFEVAMASFQNRGAPELLVYRKRPPAQPADPAQAAAVDRFFSKWFMDQQQQSATGAYHWFETSEQFTDTFTLHLRKLLRRFLPRPNNLPTPISSFVGRRELLETIRTTLMDSGTRLLTLVGPGGSGKSRLALRTARQGLPDFDDGVFFISLAELTQAELVPATIAATLDLKPAEGGTPESSLIDALRDREMLLVLDNFEQVQGATAFVHKLLTGCPNVRVLATSRAALRVTGARTIQVPPLHVPDLTRLTLERARSIDAITLFVERATEARPDFKLTQDNYRDVAKICASIDGLPLAIELATSRLRSMDTARLLKSMTKRFAVLKGGADELLDHQKSLRELVNWSYELLTEEEQMLWRRMAVFAGGFDMDAAEQVCDPDDDFIVDVEVEGLVDKSLATINFDGEPRVTMLTTLREFALDRLREVGEYETYQRRLVEWVVDYTTLHDSDGSRTLDSLAQLDKEHSNIMAAMNYCIHGPTPDLVAAVQIASTAWYHWFERGYIEQAQEYLQLAEDTSLAIDPSLRAQALRGLGAVSRFHGDLADARKHCETARQVAREAGDINREAAAVGELGAIMISLGDMDKAAEFLDQAIAVRRDQSQNPAHLSFLLSTRGVVYHLQGDLQAAKQHYQESLQTGSAAGDTDTMASALVNMGEIAEAEDDVEAAYTHYRDSLKLFYERGKKVAIAYCTEVLAGFNIKHLHAPAKAAILFGFAATLRTRTNTPIEPFNKARLDADIAATKAALGDVDFTIGWETGAQLHIEDFLSFMEVDLDAAD